MAGRSSVAVKRGSTGVVSLPTMSTVDETQQTLDLCGEWRFCADCDDRGLRERWFDIDQSSDWDSRPVPAPWQRWLGIDWHGVCWYAREIDIPTEWNGLRVLLRLEAVATIATIWVNGCEVGTVTGDYVPYELDLTDFVRAGERSTLVIRIDDACGHITKGFHDVLSAHHGGLWQPASLRAASDLHIRPNGLAVHADPNTGEVTINASFDQIEHRGGQLRATIQSKDGQSLESFAATIDPSTTTFTHTLTCNALEPWSPESPSLYELVVETTDADGRVEHTTRRFGARTVTTNGTRVELNGKPIQIRGILHWGHEPAHIAPAPTPEQVRAEFAQFRALGFNCVCLCMWYPPPHFFEIADETGMIIWQEHPVWQSPMANADLPEYQRLFTAFLRRDQQHASVLIVSSTCEHPNYDPNLAQWWWDTARTMLPHTLLQVQTSSFAWSNPELTDLHDEHTYDNNNRWVHYLDDLQHTLRALPEKPFVMGETILFTSWVDVPALLDRIGTDRPWWLTQRFTHYAQWEAIWRSRYGDEVIERFKRQGDRHHLLGRQFQIEQFRRYPNHAGVVTNHLRDVPQCACGFMDDLDRWRFAPDQTRGWLGDVGLILITPDHRRSFLANERIRAHLAIANFGPRDLDHELIVTMTHDDSGTIIVRETARCVATRGDVTTIFVPLSFPAVTRPTRVRVTVDLPEVNRNTWDLWVFPEVDLADLAREGIARLEGMPFADSDRAPDAIEAGYSRGFGLPVRTWINRLPHPEELAPSARPWWHGDPIPRGTHLILTHKLTDHLVDWMARGGRILLFCSKTIGGLGAQYEWLFGQVPLVIEQGPIPTGGSDWMVDLLGFDLTRTYARVIPVDDLGLREAVDPLARLCYTHDSLAIRFFDQLFAARVGDGAMIASSLDHRDPVGRFLLRRCIDSLLHDHCTLGGGIAPDTLKRHTVEGKVERGGH